MRILIADDDRDLAGFMKAALAREGFAADAAYDGEEALLWARQDLYDVILLDVEMPKRDGFSVLKALRAEKHAELIFMVTNHGAEAERVKGLDQGADDYVVKPFSIQELVARIRATLRRRTPAATDPLRPSVFVAGPLKLDTASRTVACGGEPIDLTKKEFELLEYFMRRPQAALNKAAIAQAVWGIEFERDFNVVEAHVGHLREKLRPAKGIKIETLHGAGYRFEVAPAVSAKK